MSRSKTTSFTLCLAILLTTSTLAPSAEATRYIPTAGPTIATAEAFQFFYLQKHACVAPSSTSLTFNFTPVRSTLQCATRCSATSCAGVAIDNGEAAGGGLKQCALLTQADLPPPNTCEGDAAATLKIYKDPNIEPVMSESGVPQLRTG